MTNQAQWIRWEDQKAESRRAVRQAVQDGADTRVAIKKKTGLSGKNVDARLEELIENGDVRFEPPPSPGKHGHYFYFHPDSSYRFLWALGRLPPDRLARMNPSFLQWAVVAGHIPRDRLLRTRPSPVRSVSDAD